MEMEIYSRTLLSYLSNLIDEQPLSTRIELKSITKCQKKLVPPKVGMRGAFLMSNGEKVQFFGIQHCKNPFGCPCCTARIMANYAAQFAALIEEMKKRGYFAFMMTFTVPHLQFMKCHETTEILYQTMRYCKRVKSHKKIYGALAKFFDEYVDHYVHVLEYTYGKNGWHPHIHGLHFCKVEHKDEILQYAAELNEYWLKQTKRITLKTYPHLTSLIEGLYENSPDKDTGCYISQKDGKIFECEAAHYVAGWGLSKELTSLEHKTAASGHLTPHQILEKAYNGDKQSEIIYINFLLSLRKKVHRRVTWSRTGIYAIAKTALQQNKCREMLKKKGQRSADVTQKWKVLLWFDQEQWNYISELSRDYKVPLVSNILYLAGKQKEILLEFLAALNIDYHLPCEHFFSQHIENIYNEEVG